jgi:hypothetical protein
LSSVAIDNHLKEIARLLARQAARSWLAEQDASPQASVLLDDFEPTVTDETRVISKTAA